MSEFTPTEAGADQYFSPDNHHRGAEWDAHDVSIRRGALATAKRELEAYLDRELQVPFTGDIFDTVAQGARDYWAAYEQALDILDRQVRLSPTSNVRRLGSVPDEAPTGPRISPLALNFARVARTKIGRGN